MMMPYFLRAHKQTALELLRCCAATRSRPAKTTFFPPHLEVTLLEIHKHMQGRTYLHYYVHALPGLKYGCICLHT